MKKHIGECDGFVLKINCKDHVLIRKSPDCRFYYDDVFAEVIADKRYTIAEDSYYQDRPRLGLPWDYPGLITCIGKIGENESPDEVLKDIKKLPVLDFLLKYYIGAETGAHSISTVSDGYMINDVLKITFQWRVVFEWINSEDVHKEKYISDQWWYTAEEVMHDLETKNFLKYGKKYDAFWRL